ncbi:hypothetical protein Q5O12_26385, partial [Klebsiella pneumoniae]|uniref:hypothetical protein n=1 Tax=Klebsiella pneumoniae TaxID=573 RepID=UPI002730AD25
MHKKNISIKSITLPRFTVLLGILITGSLFMTTSLFANQDTEERFGIEFPELSPIRTPTITEYQLDNGMEFLLCEDRY